MPSSELQYGTTFNTASLDTDSGLSGVVATPGATVSSMGATFLLYYDPTLTTTWVIVTDGTATVTSAGLSALRSRRSTPTRGGLDCGAGRACAVSRAPSNLPSPLTRLVGRSEEVAQQSAVLASPDVRLLTFVGAAGVGKTRLALAVADGSDDGYRHDSSVVLEALRLFYEFADFAGIAESLEILSAYAGRLGNGRGVARGSGVAEVLRKSVRTPHFPCQRETYRSMPSAARQAVDQVVWSAAWAEGAAPPDEAIAEQLGRA